MAEVKNQSKTNLYIREVAYLLVGCALYALSVVLFMDRIHLIPGSVTGIAVIVKALFHFPIGAVNVAINVPLILVAMFFLGKKMLVYTVITILSTSAMMDYLAFLPPMTTDFMLASIFGGILMGIGLGMILKVGATTGGTTVIGRLIVRKHPHIQIGYILMAGDFIIITVGSFLLRDWNLMLYSLINLYICSIINNKVIYASNQKIISFIHSERYEEVAGRLKDELHCKIDLIPRNKDFVCYIDRSEYDKMKKIVSAADENAVCAAVNVDYSFGALGKPFTFGVGK